MQRYDWDHIDPDYPEGSDRPYQLVCGLTNEFNLVERDRSTNSSKSNRFLPWRVSHNEVGAVPVNKGDLCQFLDRETGEWVLEEFMGEWWKESTRDLCGGHIAGSITLCKGVGIHAPGVASVGGSIGGKTIGRRNVESGHLDKIRPLAGNKGGLVNAKNKTGVCGRSSDKMSKDGRLGGLIQGPKAVKAGSGIHSKFMCLKTGHIANPGALAIWQRKRGIDTSKRVELTPEEKAFIFLWD
jgi:hypothetical protein